jgi:hypothetical protein
VITGLLVHLLAVTLSGIASLMPSFPGPAAVFGPITDGLSTVAGYVGSLSFWLPFGALGTGLVVLAGLGAVALTIKLVRIVASFLTLGGGSAA